MSIFQQRAEQSKIDFPKIISPEGLRQMLKEKIHQSNIEMVKSDVLPFVKNPRELDIWSTDYFLQLVDRVRV
jgi:hypothetical protein